MPTQAAHSQRERGNVPPQELLEEYLWHIRHVRQLAERTVQAYRSDVSRFLVWCEETGHTPVMEHLTEPVMLRYLNSFEGLSANTIRRCIHGVSAWFEFLIRQGLVESNPTRGIRLPKRPRRIPKYPSPDEIESLLAAAETPLEQVAMSLLAGAGLRRGELLGLDLGDVSDDLSELRVIGKGDRERAIPLPVGARSALERYLEFRGTAPGPLLLNRAGHRLGVTSFRRMFIRVLDRAGLAQSGYTPHDLRHGYATMLVRAGVDLGTVRDLLGHSDLSTTSLYLHSDLQSKRAAVERLPLRSNGGKADAQKAQPRPRNWRIRGLRV